MKRHICLFLSIWICIGSALASVGGLDSSAEEALNVDVGASYAEPLGWGSDSQTSTGSAQPSGSFGSYWGTSPQGIVSGGYSATIPQSTSYSEASASQSWSPSSTSIGSYASSPSISGPYEEHISPSDLRLGQPQAETFQPDGSLGFVAATPPNGALPSTGASVAGAGSWYWPGSIASTNRYYVQTGSGFSTVAGCSFRGYLPLWAEISSSENFYTYEWYPGKWTPTVNWWGWTWPGFKKGWFGGDVVGWHILCYHCRDFSNYVYIYVWPSGTSTAQAGAYAPSYGSSGSYGSYGSSGSYGVPTSSGLETSSNAPTPPDPNAEGLVLPDFNLITQYQDSCSASSCSGQVYSSQAVYPQKACYSKNEYYIQVWPSKLTTTAGARCGERLPLWSKITTPGTYWSFEWSPSSSFPRSYYSFPEINNFGYKGSGWTSTWFQSRTSGWHILIYICNDWSNYIYIYVWP